MTALPDGLDRSLEAVIAENYPAVQYAFVELLSEHLADLSRSFGGDLQQVLLLATIGQVYLEHVRRQRAVGELRGLSASRLADVSGIPRQTVRRKLVILKERGWIEETTPGSWRLAMKQGQTNARRDLNDVDLRSQKRIARFLAALLPLFKA